MNSYFFSQMRRSFAVIASAFFLANASNAGEVVFGHVSSATHPLFNARELQAGLKLSFDTVNANGGVNGNTLTLAIADDHLESEKMVALANEQVKDPRIVALLGYLNSPALIELSSADFYRKHQIAHIAPIQGSNSVVNAANVFPFRSSHEDEVRALLNEAKRTGKRNIAIVHYNVAFGPAISKFAIEQSNKLGIPISGVHEIDSRPVGGDMMGSVHNAITALEKSKPDVILLIAGGKSVWSFVKPLRERHTLDSSQLYGLSVISPRELVAHVPPLAARGMLISQAVPYPFAATSKLVTDYHRAIKQHSPEKEPSFEHIEGFIAGQIAIQALKRAGPHPTRQTILKALSTMGQLDLGGPVVTYTETSRSGWGKTDLAVIDKNGRLIQ